MKASDVWHVSAISLQGDQEKPLNEGMKVKLGLPWRPREVRDARALGYLRRRGANRERNQSKGKKCAAVNRAERTWRAEQCFAIRHGGAERGVCPAGVQTSFGPVFPPSLYACMLEAHALPSTFI